MALTPPGHVPKGPSCRCVDTAEGPCSCRGSLSTFLGLRSCRPPVTPSFGSCPPEAPAAARAGSWVPTPLSLAGLSVPTPASTVAPCTSPALLSAHPSAVSAARFPEASSWNPLSLPSVTLFHPPIPRRSAECSGSSLAAALVRWLRPGVPGTRRGSPAPRPQRPRRDRAPRA